MVSIRSEAGDTIDFLFGNAFFAPEESKLFFALTDATNYVPPARRPSS